MNYTMKNLKLLCILISLSLFQTSCSSDDDLNQREDSGNEEELSFDIGSSERSFGNAYVTFEGNQTDVDFYRLHVLPPGATFDSSSGVFTGGSTGDYLTLDFKVSESEDFLINGDYELAYGTFPLTVEGVFYNDVTIDLSGTNDIPVIFLPEDSDDVSLEIDSNNFSIDLDLTGAQASGTGSMNNVEVFGSYSSSYEFIELD